ncbi:unnamed protein product [Phytophthora fragariaefolia]|uniref:Unnamed protein product n=1 Tax=Phytophthora fragariaefolia TaxID=1490495 RepID=A0A9W6XC22_9STRA|nr:unnamed protein product [Phytophthora fragariaefolia]
MLLCTVAAKFKTLGRKMWEGVAREYNLRKGRSWLVRDFDSLRRKVRNLYDKPKPTGNSDGLPPRLRPIALAHEVQHAIEMKAGAHTSHDGFDRGQDDAHLLRDVSDVFGPTGGDAQEEEGNDDDGDLASRDWASEEERKEEEESQLSVVDFRQRAHLNDNPSHEPTPNVTGSVLTRHGAISASLGEDVWSDDEEESTPSASEVRRDLGGAAETTNAITAENAEAERRGCGGGEASEQPDCESATAESRVYGEEGKPADGKLATNSQSPGATSRSISPGAQNKAVGRPRRGCDLRVMRDNLDEMTGRASAAGGKRDTPDSSATGATYASNKRLRAKKRLDQLRKEVDEATEKHSAIGADMLQVLMFMREDADRRAETEDRRRREDREALLASEKKERKERECRRRDKAAEVEAQRCQELKLRQQRREEQNRKEAAVAAESRRRYEERVERDRAEAREHHDQIMLLITTLQRRGPQSL